MREATRSCRAPGVVKMFRREGHPEPGAEENQDSRVARTPTGRPPDDSPDNREDEHADQRDQRPLTRGSRHKSGEDEDCHHDRKSQWPDREQDASGYAEALPTPKPVPNVVDVPGHGTDPCQGGAKITAQLEPDEHR